MTLRLPPRGVASAAQMFELELHPTIASYGTTPAFASALKTGRLVTVMFQLFCAVDRTSVIGWEPLFYLPEALAPLGTDDAADLPGHWGAWYLCDANSVLGGGYPRFWRMRFVPYWAPPGGDFAGGVYDSQGNPENLFSPITPDEERVEVVGGFTYIGLS